MKQSTKTGKNSAYRKMQQRRQEERRFSIVGLVAGLIFLAAVIFGGSSNKFTSEGEQPGDSGYIEIPLHGEGVGTSDSGSHDFREKVLNPVLRYARGVPPIEEMDEIIESSSGD